MGLALPILCTNVLQSLSVSVNSFWVGHYLGEAAIAATTNATVIIVLLYGLTSGPSLAGTILLGKRVGAGEMAAAKDIVFIGTVFLTFASAAISISASIPAAKLLAYMGTPIALRSSALQYLRIMLIGFPLMCVYGFVASAMRATGDTVTPFAFLILSAALDAALNPIIIFGFGPIPGLGVSGSSLATVVAYTVGLASMTGYLYLRQFPLRITRAEVARFTMKWPILRAFIMDGAAMTVQLFVIYGQELLLVSFVNRFGVRTMAAYGASAQLWSYVQMPGVAVSAAVMVLTSQCVGEGRGDRARAIACEGVACAMVVTATVVWVLWVFQKQAIGLFLPAGSPALAVAGHINGEVAWSFVIFCGCAVLFALSNVAGAVWVPVCILAVILVVRMGVIDAALSKWGAEAIWWSFPISASMALLLAVLWYQWARLSIKDESHLAA